MPHRSRCRGGPAPSTSGALLLALAALVLASCTPPAAGSAPTFVPPATEPPTPVAEETDPVTPEAVEEPIKLRGRVEAKREEPLAFRIGGRLDAVHVSAGDRVEEGQLLAELYAADLQRQVADAEYELKDRQTALATEELKLQLAEHAVSKARLSGGGAETEAEIQRSMQELRVRQAERYVQRAREAVEAASHKVAETKLKAPFSGVVVSIDKAVGDQVAAYETVGVLADPSDLRVIAMALVDEVVEMRMGDAVEVQIDPYPDQTFTGSVVEIASEPVVWQGRAAYEVTVGFDEGQDLPTAVGLFASILIDGGSRASVPPGSGGSEAESEADNPPTATPQPTATSVTASPTPAAPTPEPTATLAVSQTLSTPTAVSEATPSAIPTSRPTATATQPVVLPTNTPTPVPPTDTPVPQPTSPPPQPTSPPPQPTSPPEPTSPPPTSKPEPTPEPTPIP